MPTNLPGKPFVAEAMKKVRSCEATNATTWRDGFAVGSTWNNQSAAWSVNTIDPI
jgi:hypothetical protein